MAIVTVTLINTFEGATIAVQYDDVTNLVTGISVHNPATAPKLTANFVFNGVAHDMVFQPGTDIVNTSIAALNIAVTFPVTKTGATGIAFAGLESYGFTVG